MSAASNYSENNVINALVYGALARLHDIPGQPFTDPVSASAATAQYLSQVRRARVESDGRGSSLT